MDAIEALKTRRSVRAYKADPVPQDVLEDVVDCGRMAATAHNDQPWEFVVVTDREMLKRLGEATDHGRFIVNAPACVVILSKPTKYYLEDGSAATQNVLVAAHARGLGSCWVAGDKKPYAAAVLQMLGAPPELKLVSMIPLGHPAETPSRPKRPLPEMLHRERY